MGCTWLLWSINCSALNPPFSTDTENLIEHIGTTMIKGTWCSGITSASHAEGPGFKSQCVHFAQIASTFKPYATEQQSSASAGNRTRVTSMATMYSTTRPLMLLTYGNESKCNVPNTEGGAARRRAAKEQYIGAATSSKMHLTQSCGTNT